MISVAKILTVATFSVLVCNTVLAQGSMMPDPATLSPAAGKDPVCIEWMIRAEDCRAMQAGKITDNGLPHE